MLHTVPFGEILGHLPEALAAATPAALYAGRHRLLERVVDGPGGATVGYELDTRGGAYGRPEGAQRPQREDPPQALGRGQAQPALPQGPEAPPPRQDAGRAGRSGRRARARPRCS